MKIDLGLQLFSLRDIVGNDLPGVLKKVKGAGYDSAEFAGFYGMSAEDVKTELDKLGLVCNSTHTGIDQLQNNLDEVIAFHKTIGAKYIIIPAGNLDSEQYLDGTAKVCNEAGKKIHDAGMQLLYHNHGREFELKYNGVTALETLAAKTTPETLGFQLDIFWATYVDLDPSEVIKRLGSRCHSLHLKDMKDKKDKVMTECGTGVVDIRGAMKTAQSFGISSFVVEQDVIAIDPIESVAISCANIRRIADSI